jgi:hypothetical protein
MLATGGRSANGTSGLDGGCEARVITLLKGTETGAMPYKTKEGVRTATDPDTRLDGRRSTG